MLSSSPGIQPNWKLACRTSGYDRFEQQTTVAADGKSPSLPVSIEEPQVVKV